MITFQQSTGEFREDGGLIDTGYAGFGEGKNNPAMQRVHDVGPLPCGDYVMGKPEDRPKTIGHYAIPLTPVDPNSPLLFGRGGFFWHGCNGKGTASHGCPVSLFQTRKKAYDNSEHTGDKLFRVIP